MSHTNTHTHIHTHTHTHTKSDNIHVYAAIDRSLYVDLLIFSPNSYGFSRLPV